MEKIIFDAEQDVIIEPMFFQVQKSLVFFRAADAYGFGETLIEFDGYHLQDIIDGYGLSIVSSLQDGYLENAHYAKYITNNLYDSYLNENVVCSPFNLFEFYVGDGYSILDGYRVNAYTNNTCVNSLFVSLNCREIKEQIDVLSVKVNMYETEISLGEATKDIVKLFLPAAREDLATYENILEMLRRVK